MDFINFAREYFEGIPFEYVGQLSIIAAKLPAAIKSDEPLIFTGKGKHPLAKVQIAYLEQHHPDKELWVVDNMRELRKMREGNGTR